MPAFGIGPCFGDSIGAIDAPADGVGAEIQSQAVIKLHDSAPIDGVDLTITLPQSQTLRHLQIRKCALSANTQISVFG